MTTGADTKLYIQALNENEYCTVKFEGIRLTMISIGSRILVVIDTARTI